MIIKINKKNYRNNKLNNWKKMKNFKTSYYKKIFIL